MTITKPYLQKIITNCFHLTEEMENLHMADKERACEKSRPL